MALFPPGCLGTGRGSLVNAHGAQSILAVKAINGNRSLDQPLIVTNNRKTTVYVDLCSPRLMRKAAEKWVVVGMSGCAGCPSPAIPVLPHDSASVPFTVYEPDMLKLVGPNGKLVPGRYRIDVQIAYGYLPTCAPLVDVHSLSSASFEVVDK